MLLQILIALINKLIYMNYLHVIDNEQLINGNYIKLLNSKNLHVICTAQKIKGYCNTFLSSLGEPQNKIDTYCDTVNSKYEPGCLFPKYTLTLFPLFKESRAESIREDLYKFFGDTFLAQNKYFKSEKMLFCFDENSWPDITLPKSILEEVLQEQLLEGVSDIYFCSNL